MLVAGQTAATTRTLHNIGGFPSARELAEAVQCLPGPVRGRIVGGFGTNILPVTEPGQLIKLSIKHRRLHFANEGGHFSLFDSQGKQFAGGAFLTEACDAAGKSRIIFCDKNGKALCLAVQDRLYLDKHYTVYGLHPLYESDSPQEQEQGKDFFPWFRVRDTDPNQPDFRCLLAWNGGGFVPAFRIRSANCFATNTNAVSDLLPPGKCDILVCDTNDDSKVYALMSKQKDRRKSGWALEIAPGTDVVAMIMLGAMLDEMVGWFH